MWEQCLDGEYAMATGRKAASVLIDLDKAYEMFGHRMCLARFVDAEIPMRYARWCLMCYGGPRVLRLDGVFSDVFCVGASIVAGCAGATTLLRAVLLKTCDLACQAGLAGSGFMLSRVLPAPTWMVYSGMFAKSVDTAPCCRQHVVGMPR